MTARLQSVCRLPRPGRRGARRFGKTGGCRGKDPYKTGMPHDAQSATRIILRRGHTQRCGLQNAASVVGLILTTDAMVAESPKEDAGRAGHGHRYMGM